MNTIWWTRDRLKCQKVDICYFWNSQKPQFSPKTPIQKTKRQSAIKVFPRRYIRFDCGHICSSGMTVQQELHYVKCALSYNFVELWELEVHHIKRWWLWCRCGTIFFEVWKIPYFSIKDISWRKYQKWLKVILFWKLRVWKIYQYEASQDDSMAKRFIFTQTVKLLGYPKQVTTVPLLQETPQCRSRK